MTKSNEQTSLLPSIELEKNGGNGVRTTEERRRFAALAVLLVAILVIAVSIFRGSFRTAFEFPSKETMDWHVPLSSKDPVHDLGLYDFDRPKGSKPPIEHTSDDALPTNAWYLNLMLVGAQMGSTQRAYTIPYVVDVEGPIPGLRIHPNHVDGSSTEVHVDMIEQNGLTLGATSTREKKKMDLSYKILETTPLGITLQWHQFDMFSSLVRGMPYATMTYDMDSSEETFYPTVASEINLVNDPIIDGHTSLHCSSTNPKPMRVEKEVELFYESDFTWLVFVSKPVDVQCVLLPDGGMQLQVVNAKEEFIMRVAMEKLCTSNKNPIYCHQEQMDPEALHIGQGRYFDLIRAAAAVYPGRNTAVKHSINEDDELVMEFDWDATLMRSDNANTTIDDLLVFALPHHSDILVGVRPFPEKYCAHSLIGPACLIKGNTWKMIDQKPPIGFRAPRPITEEYLPSLLVSLEKDLQYRLPKIYRKGYGDTYFSGKMLAKLARICMVAEEVRELCQETSCPNQPSDTDMEAAVDALKHSVEIWINGNAGTPFVYDGAWGGVVSCGCAYSEGSCVNSVPECPAFDDPGLDFGNAYYNDMHFHYGYHIYGAAAVAHFDPAWGREFFEQVLLLIRNIANPSKEDRFFTQWRHKDWYQGHSWASGIATAPHNGRNQESSSEAIMAYEAVALYGMVMTKAWEEVGANEETAAAKRIEDTGVFLTASELRSSRKYWHVEPAHEGDVKIFPAVYQAHVVGIMWQTMAQLQTWFGNFPYLAYGIQLLPITPISESRDSIVWLESMYGALAESCDTRPDCSESGWKILQIAALASVGYREKAAEQAIGLKPAVFEDAGGNGHSLSNTLWYIATRPIVENPIPLNETEVKPPKKVHEVNALGPELDYCGKPSTCTDYVLDTIADLYTCRQRIGWLANSGMSVHDACVEVASHEFPNQCGLCNPLSDVTPDDIMPASCPPCSDEECQSSLNRCPVYKHTYVCSEGNNYGGCSPYPWMLQKETCTACCELTDCTRFGQSLQEVVPMSDGHNCPRCSKIDCRRAHTQCPPDMSTAYLCLKGPSFGGCSKQEWKASSEACLECCQASEECTN